MTLSVLEFGSLVAGVDYVLRPGGYAVVRNSAGQIALISAPAGYVLPGDGQEPYESPEAAAIRESYEECGLNIHLQSLIGTVDELVFAKAEGIYFRKRCTFYRAVLIQQDDCGESDHHLIWVTPAQAGELLRFESQRWAVTTCGP